MAAAVNSLPSAGRLCDDGRMLPKRTVMDPAHTATAPVEVELKLAIVNRDANEARLRLARLPVLARRIKPVRGIDPYA